MGVFKINIQTVQKLLFVLVALLCVTYFNFTWNSVEKDKFDQAIQIARSVIATLPIDDLKALEGKPGDIDKSQYRVVKNLLKEIINVNTEARFAHIFIVREDKIYFIADSEPEASKDYSPPGQEYSESDIALMQSFNDGKVHITGKVTDRWGTWRSIFKKSSC